MYKRRKPSRSNRVHDRHTWLTLAKKGMLVMETHSPRISRFSQLERFLRLVRLFFWTLWVIYRERRRVMRTHALGSVAAQPASPALLRVLAACPRVKLLVTSREMLHVRG